LKKKKEKANRLIRKLLEERKRLKAELKHEHESLSMLMTSYNRMLEKDYIKYARELILENARLRRKPLQSNEAQEFIYHARYIILGINSETIRKNQTEHYYEKYMRAVKLALEIF
jgi:glycogen synthase